MSEDQYPRTPDLLGTTASSYYKTNLCMADKNGFFSSIMTSMTHSLSESSSSLTDLVVLCTGPNEPLHISVHSAVLASQSPLLRDLLLSVTAPTLMLPEVEVKIMWNMLDLLYTGRCNLREEDVPSVVQLMTSLGLHTVVRSLEQRGGGSDKPALLVRSSGLAWCYSGTEDGPGLDRRQSRQEYPVVSSPLYNDFQFCGGKKIGEALHSRTTDRKKRLKRDSDPISLEDNVPEACFNNNVGVSNTSEAKTFSYKKEFPGRYCVMCGKKERNLYTLKVHYTNTHFFTEVAALITDKKSSQCELCGQQFSECENLFCNVVRHRGATHKDVLKFVQKECGNDEGVTYDHCEICDVKKENWKSESLGHHLIQDHYKVKLKELLAPGQDACTICDSKCRTIYDMIAHIGLTHGFAMRMYRDFLTSKSATPVKAKRSRKSKLYKAKVESCLKKATLKLIKKCHLCHLDIAAAGIYWRFPLYSHFSRIHFGDDLIRDFRTEDSKCSVCGIKEDSIGERLFLVHLGAKHRLVENYLDKSTLLEFEEANDLEGTFTDNTIEAVVLPVEYSSTTVNDNNTETEETQNNIQSPFNQQEEDTFQGELLLLKEQLNQPLVGEDNQINEKVTSAKKKENIKDDNPAFSLLKCPHCEKKLQERSLQTHLVSKHFKRDCEEAIKMILQKTDGKCPKCPAQLKFSKSVGGVDWSVHIHFARSHKIAEDLDVSGDKDQPNQENVLKIMRKLCPQD